MTTSIALICDTPYLILYLLDASHCELWRAVKGF